ncbi:MAG TPA: peptidoglycan-binding protein LysM, partial [Geobacteraceae bacterium]|nr:peptidoglycan-binding protein LysM [Geobacteraceae bacterium]
ARTIRTAKRSAPKPVEKKTVGHRLTLFKGSSQTGNGGVESAKLVWEKLLPGQHLSKDSLSIKGEKYTLDLSPDRFPLFPAADGGKILIEAGGKLSPLVKSLIQGHDPGTRFVTYTPHNRKLFFANLLSAAGFYSVEEDFTIAFGSDPKLTVTTDFKVENDANSPLQHDIFLFNSEPRSGSIPAVLAEYLASQGFRVIDFYPSGQRERPMAGSSINVITDKEPSALADKVMSALDLGYEQERKIDLLSMGEGGVALRVKADRYFEKNGEKYVVSVFKGDPENYTLLRLLESERYHVIMLTPGEDFRSVAGKILSQLRLPGSYAMQNLIESRDIPYTIQMSGFMLNAPDKRGKLFMTGSKPERLIGELLELNGYTIHDSHDEVVRK